MSDTVGFIRKLPHGLVEAFQSTLEQVASADLLVHVVDASHPEPDNDIAAVDEVLAEIGATEVPRLIALNKLDAVDADTRERLLRRFPDASGISAITGEGVDVLLERVGEHLDRSTKEVDAILPYSAGQLLAHLHDSGRVVSSSHESDGVHVRVRVGPADLAAIRPYLLERV